MYDNMFKYIGWLSLIVMGFLVLSRTPQTSYAQVDCGVDYVVVNQWSSGFQADVTITNYGGMAVSGWSLDWLFAGNEQFDSGWNADFAATGNSVTVSNAASHWNGTIQPNGGTVSFGFQGSHSGDVQVPAMFTVNGTVCNGDQPQPTNTPPVNTPTPVNTAVSTNTPAPTNTVPAPTGTPTGVPPTVVAGSCEVAYNISNEWSSGFTAEVTITNNSSIVIQGWQLAWSLVNG